MVNYYNQAEAGSQDRADALRAIWGKGGVPVIGSGKARAGVQDFRGVRSAMTSRGIDTGMVPGTPEAEAHVAALAKHENQSGIYGSPTAPYARLAPLRANSGDGLFSRGRVTRNLSKEDQKLERAIKLQRAQNEGQIGAARQYVEGQIIDRQASREERAAGRAAEAQAENERMTMAEAAAEQARQQAVDYASRADEIVDMGYGRMGWQSYDKNGVPQKKEFSETDQRDYDLARSLAPQVRNTINRDTFAAVAASKKTNAPQMFAYDRQENKIVVIPVAKQNDTYTGPDDKKYGRYLDVNKNRMLRLLMSEYEQRLPTT